MSSVRSLRNILGPRSSNIYKLPVETVKPWNKATNSTSSGCKKLSDVVVYEAFEVSVYGSMAFRGNQISAGSMKMVQASWIASVDGVIDLCCTALQIHCRVRRPVVEKANPTSIAIKLPMLVAYAINQEKNGLSIGRLIFTNQCGDTETMTTYFKYFHGTRTASGQDSTTSTKRWP